MGGDREKERGERGAKEIKEKRERETEIERGKNEERKMKEKEKSREHGGQKKWREEFGKHTSLHYSLAAIILFTQQQ